MKDTSLLDVTLTFQYNELNLKQIIILPKKTKCLVTTDGGAAQVAQEAEQSRAHHRIACLSPGSSCHMSKGKVSPTCLPSCQCVLVGE